MIKFRTVLRLSPGQFESLSVNRDAEDAWRGDRGMVYGFFHKLESGSLIVRRDSNMRVWFREAKHTNDKKSMYDQLVVAERTRAGWSELASEEE